MGRQHRTMNVATGRTGVREGAGRRHVQGSGLGGGEEKSVGRAVRVHSAWLHGEHTARPDSVLARSSLLTLLLYLPSASTSLSCLQHMALVTSLLWPPVTWDTTKNPLTGQPTFSVYLSYKLGLCPSGPRHLLEP